MRRKKEDAEATRLSILRVAGKVFSEKGFEAARLSEIAEEANVTRGAIYWHFVSKRGLFEELIKHKIKPFFELLNSVISLDLNPIEKLRTVLLKTAKNIESNDDFKTSQQLEFIITGIIGRDEVIKEYLNREATRIKNAFMQVVEEGQALGEIKDNVDAMDIMSHLFIFLRGLTFLLMKRYDLVGMEMRVEPLVDLEINAIRK
jgi:TetR/AcrR family acrAB operon transcriptional repressor